MIIPDAGSVMTGPMSWRISPRVMRLMNSDFTRKVRRDPTVWCVPPWERRFLVQPSKTGTWRLQRLPKKMWPETWASSSKRSAIFPELKREESWVCPFPSSVITRSFESVKQSLFSLCFLNTPPLAVGIPLIPSPWGEG